MEKQYTIYDYINKHTPQITIFDCEMYYKYKKTPIIVKKGEIHILDKEE